MKKIENTRIDLLSMESRADTIYILYLLVFFSPSDGFLKKIGKNDFK